MVPQEATRGWESRGRWRITGAQRSRARVPSTPIQPGLPKLGSSGSDVLDALKEGRGDGEQHDAAARRSDPDEAPVGPDEAADSGHDGVSRYVEQRTVPS
jgi:hypothetical protein